MTEKKLHPNQPPKEKRPLRYIHVSRTPADVIHDVPGVTYNKGRNAAKRRRRAA